MMEQRRKLRAEVEGQKQAIMAKFEEMKKQGSGNMTPKDLTALIGAPGEGQVGAFTVEQTVGTASAQPAGAWKAKSSVSKAKPAPAATQKDTRSAEIMGKEKIGLLRKKQNEELLQILEEEQRLEEGRERQLAAAASDIERSRLDKIFGLERAKSSQRIVGISEYSPLRAHNSALKALAARYQVTLDL